MSYAQLEKEWAFLDARVLALNDELEVKAYHLEKHEQGLHREQSNIAAFEKTLKYLKFQSKVVVLSEFSLIKRKLAESRVAVEFFATEVESIKAVMLDVENHLRDAQKALLSVQNKLDNWSNVIQFDQRTNQVPR